MSPSRETSEDGHSIARRSIFLCHILGVCKRRVCRLRRQGRGNCRYLWEVGGGRGGRNGGKILIAGRNLADRPGRCRNRVTTEQRILRGCSVLVRLLSPFRWRLQSRLRKHHRDRENAPLYGADTYSSWPSVRRQPFRQPFAHNKGFTVIIRAYLARMPQ